MSFQYELCAQCHFGLQKCHFQFLFSLFPITIMYTHRFSKICNQYDDQCMKPAFLSFNTRVVINTRPLLWSQTRAHYVCSQLLIHVTVNALPPFRFLKHMNFSKLLLVLRNQVGRYLKRCFPTTEIKPFTLKQTSKQCIEPPCCFNSMSLPTPVSATCICQFLSIWVIKTV